MTDKINELLRRVEEFKPKAAAEIEEFRIKVLGKKGELNALMEEFKTVAPELKREMGQQLNKLKVTALDRINALREQLQDAIADDGAATEDMTRPGSAEPYGMCLSLCPSAGAAGVAAAAALVLSAAAAAEHQ